MKNTYQIYDTKVIVILKKLNQTFNNSIVKVAKSIYIYLDNIRITCISSFILDRSNQEKFK